MHLEKIEALIALLHDSSVGELALREGESTIRLTRFKHLASDTLSTPRRVDQDLTFRTGIDAEPEQGGATAPRSASRDAANADADAHGSDVHANRPAQATQAGKPDAEATVLSPMFGVVHLTPSPNDPTFVRVGDTVSVGTTLCTVEAMKTFNAVEAETTGVVTAILVNAGDEVKPGQVLFRIAS